MTYLAWVSPHSSIQIMGEFEDGVDMSRFGLSSEEVLASRAICQLTWDWSSHASWGLVIDPLS